MNWKALSYFILFQWICLLQPKEAFFVNQKSLSENIQSGILFAGKIFGIDQASEIADLVANSFSSKSNQKRQDNVNDPIDFSNQNTMMVSNILQIIGLDSAKIGALAVNGIIFIAQVIGRSLVASFTEKIAQKVPNLPPTSERKMISGSPLDWILESKSPVLVDTLKELRNSSLPQKLVELFGTLEEKSGDADCIKLLLCKTSPLIWGMQRACNDSMDRDEQTDDEESNDKGLNSFFKYLPDMHEFSYHGDACESRYNGCKVITTDKLDG